MVECCGAVIRKDGHTVLVRLKVRIQGDPLVRGIYISRRISCAAAVLFGIPVLECMAYFINIICAGNGNSIFITDTRCNRAAAAVQIIGQVLGTELGAFILGIFAAGGIAGAAIVPANECGIRLGEAFAAMERYSFTIIGNYRVGRAAAATSIVVDVFGKGVVIDVKEIPAQVQLMGKNAAFAVKTQNTEIGVFCFVFAIGIIEFQRQRGLE